MQDSALETAAATDGDVFVVPESLIPLCWIPSRCPGELPPVLAVEEALVYENQISSFFQCVSSGEL